MKLLPSITSIFDWRGKIEEVKKLGLEEAALFLTCVSPEERPELFGLLKETKIRKIPFVHLRSDHDVSELDYLVENYRTKVFNVHTKREFPYPAEAAIKKYRKIIYVENTYEPLDEDELNEFAGICLDFSHLENNRVYEPHIYKHNIEIIERRKIGCNHISPAKKIDVLLEREVEYAGNRHPHFLENLSELDYLKNYPSRYFSDYTALEMENSIKEQLEAKKYIESFIVL